MSQARVDPAAAAGASPVLALLTAPPGRLLLRRPAIVAVGLAARLGRPRAVAIWPDTERPLVAVDVSSAGPAKWIRETFEPGAGGAGGRSPRRTLRRLAGAATWNVFRARGLAVGPPWPAAIDAVEVALKRPLTRPRVGLYSPSGAPTAKASLFVFEAGATEPVALVVTMALVEHEARLRHELDAIEAARAQLRAETEVAAALPRAPLWTGTLDDRYGAVLPIDSAAAGTGVEDRARALAWLRRFQACTAEPEAAWSGERHERELRAVNEAWSALSPRSLGGAIAIAGRLLERLEGTPLRQCAVHGDFWRGNIATTGDQLRVFDWEWWRPAGHPLFDVWTYELAELRAVADRDGGDLDPPLRLALGRATDEARARGLDPAAAAAMLMPVLAELAIRNRRKSGLPSPPEIPFSRVMGAAERLLAPAPG